MYNPENQYRCTIIRGKAQTELDDLLPAYCQIISNICPTSIAEFKSLFDAKLSEIIHNYEEKTLANHRTEIAGKLFGLWFESNEIAYCSKKTDMYLETRDNPAFFKDLVIKLQFPNGMDKIQTTKDRIANKIKFRPTPFILASLKYASENSHILYKNDIAYYILNNLEVMQGKVDYKTVVDRIVKDRESEIFYRVSTEGKQSSYNMQHITELLNLLKVANLIRITPSGIDKKILLNESELSVILKIIDKYQGVLGFDPYQYDLENTGAKNQFKKDWSAYYTSPLLDTPVENTKAADLLDEEQIIDGESIFYPLDPLSIGDEGENIALKFEKQRVQKFNKRLTNKVIHFGKQRGIGYDISSIFAEGMNPEHAIYIEVKTTKRVTEPPLKYNDQFDMTRNEWVAAEQHPDNYFIYRVYLYNKGAKIYKLDSPVKLRNDNLIFAEPLKYHIEFDNTVGVFIHEKS